jgi:crossover junction endodeoxyribonuclease RuvC
MRILGIDPGVAITGYSIIEEENNQYTCLDSGCIRTKSNVDSALRLEIIYEAVTDLINQYAPAALSIEKIFFSKNVRTAFQVGEARGVVILAATRKNLQIHQYTPLQIKQAVAGYGKAEKIQVQNMVKILLQLANIPSVDDEADAMAVALCHLQARRFNDAIKGG